MSAKRRERLQPRRVTTVLTATACLLALPCFALHNDAGSQWPGVSVSAPATGVAQLLPPWRTDAPPPPDLKLDDEALRTVEAYARFAWGFYLRQDPQASFDEAMEHLKAAVAALPESEFLLGHFVAPMMRQQDYDAVADALLPLAQANPEATQLNLVAAEALAAADRTQVAIDLLEACGRKTAWSEPDLARRAAVLYWKEKRLDGLRDLLRQLMKQPGVRETFDVHYLGAMYHRSRLELASESSAADDERRLGDRQRDRHRKQMLEHARGAAERVRGLDRERDLRQLADLLEDYEEWDALATMLGKVLSSPSLSTVPLRLLYAESLLESNQRDEGLAVLRQLRTDPNLSPLAVAEAGRLFVGADAVEDAIQMYERLLTGDRLPKSLARGLGFLYLRADRPADAIRVVKTIQAPDAHERYLLARAYQQQRNYGKAYETMRSMFALRQRTPDFGWDSVQFLLFAATLAEETGHADETIRWAEKAREQAPDDAQTANFLGYVLADHNRQLDRAESLIRQALEAEPESASFLDSLAWVFHRQGRHREALEQIFRALRAQHGLNDGVILDHAGDICQACDLDTLARIYWGEALASEEIRMREPLRTAVEQKLNAPR